MSLQLLTNNIVQNKQDAWTCIETAEEHNMASNADCVCEANVSYFEIFVNLLTFF